MILLDGRVLQNEIFKDLSKRIEHLKGSKVTPCLVTIIVGNDPASKLYVHRKLKACEQLGIRGILEECSGDINEETLCRLIETYNRREDVHGILVQKPFPKHISEEKVVTAISPYKDVDGFNPENIGLLSLGTPRFVPCTPLGCLYMLHSIEKNLGGKHVVIVGRSNLVGKPLSTLLIHEGATVTVCNSRTKDLKHITSQADILIVATGKPKMITKEHVKNGAIVIDVGIHKNNDGTISGDVDFENVKDAVKAISPVPFGVGPMTIAMLMKNTVLAAEYSKKEIN